MRVVWKFPLSVPYTDVKVGSGFNVLAVNTQSVPGLADYRNPYIWIEHDPALAPTTVRFAIYGTGHPIPDGLRWVGTFFDESFVWHVYQVPNA